MKHEKQFIAFHDKHADAIFRFCYYRIYDRDKAKELTQESFMRMWRMLTDGQKITYPKAVVYRIARNLIIDYSRKKKEESLEETQESLGDAVFMDHEQQDPNDKIDIKLALTKLRAKNEELCEPIELKYLQGLRVKEIAEVLNVSPNVVSVRIHRGINYLKEIYGD